MAEKRIGEIMQYDKDIAERVKKATPAPPVKLTDYQKRVYSEFENKEYYSIMELCEVFDVNRTTVYRWFQMGTIDYFSISRKKTIITKTQVREFLKSRHSNFYEDMEKRSPDPHVEPGKKE